VSKQQVKSADTPASPPRYAMVAVIGRPNVGKSTFVNRLVGEKISIVSDKPQTTRHRILGVRTGSRGQIVFIDTPGIHKPLYRLNRYMVRAALNSVQDADLALLLVDASQKLGHGDRYVIGVLKSISKPLLVLLNKVDLIRPSRLLPLMDVYGKELAAKEIIPMSALRGDNIELVEQKIWEYAEEGAPMFPSDMLTDRSETFRAAEIVREKILARTREELPWATAVRMDRSEVEGNLWRLFMTILVEKRSQRPIIIGRGGEFLKDVGTEAREELERTFGRKVYLSLTVEHQQQWRDSARALATLDIWES